VPSADTTASDSAGATGFGFGVFSVVDADLMETVRFAMVVSVVDFLALESGLSAGLVVDCRVLRSPTFVDDVDSMLALEALRVDFLLSPSP
jgi:hypothetical protein